MLSEELNKAIELYIGREILYDEVELIFNGTDFEISNWNIFDKAKPTIAQLTTLWNKSGKDYLNNKKLAQLRSIRNYILEQTMCISDQYNLEQLAITMNVPGAQTKVTISQALFIQWLQYWDTLRNLPDTIDINSINLEDIYLGNTTVFGTYPSSNPLNPLPGM